MSQELDFVLSKNNTDVAPFYLDLSSADFFTLVWTILPTFLSSWSLSFAAVCWLTLSSHLIILIYSFILSSLFLNLSSSASITFSLLLVSPCQIHCCVTEYPGWIGAITQSLICSTGHLCHWGPLLKGGTFTISLDRLVSKFHLCKEWRKTLKMTRNV